MDTSNSTINPLYQSSSEKKIVKDEENNIELPNAIIPEMEEEVPRDKKKKNEKKSKTRTRKRANTAILMKDINISYCSHVGWDGTVVLFFLLVLSGFSWYLVYPYSASFRNFGKEGIWIYIVLGVLYILTIIFLLKTWKSVAKDYTRRALTGRDPHRGAAGIIHFYRETFINGKYYLWKLYLIELLESFNQLNNLINVYLCSLPVEASTIICICLGVDSIVRGYEVLQNNTPERRDRQIKIDILFDTLCMIVPLGIMWFGYKVPISIDEMIQVTLFPALCLFTKLRSIFREIVRLRSFDAVKKHQFQTAESVGRKRRSIYAVLETTKVAKMQQNSMPKKVRKGFAFYNILYGVFMFVIAIVELVIASSVTCKETLLWESCVVQTPFCGNMFTPTCNCVVLNVRKHNWTEFPKELFEMNALKVMQINHGPLQTIRNDVNTKFEKLSTLDLRYNKLIQVPDSLGKLEYNRLKLANNELASLPDVVWENEHIYYLELDNNNISMIPGASVQKAKNLHDIYLSNNSLIMLPNELFDLNLITLMADGNKLTSISSNIGAAINLRYVKFNNNNNISIVPEEIGNLAQLFEVDLRNNAIASLPNTIDNLKKLEYTYLYDNPICTNGWLDGQPKIKNVVERSPEAGCKKQCSKYCLNVLLEEKTCVRDCNSKECDYQNGVCS